MISIGIVAEDGREYYAESLTAPTLAQATPWLTENVYPHLTGNRRTRQQMAAEIVDFVGRHPEFWAYYSDYDWVVLCQLYGRMIDLPETWPMFCLDLKQFVWHVGNPRLTKQTGNAHSAIDDARWVRDAFSEVHQQFVSVPIPGIWNPFVGER